MTRPSLHFAARLAFSLTLLLGLFLLVDIGEIVEILRSISIPLFLGLVGLVVADRVLMAGKWWMLLRGRGVGIGFWEAERAYYVSSYAGLFLPSTVGADTVRAVLLRKVGDSYRVVASIALERGIGLLCQTVLALFSVLILLRLELLPGRSVENLGWVLALLLVAMVVSLPLSFGAARLAGERLVDAEGVRGKLGRLAAAYGEWDWRQATVWTFFALTAIESFAPMVIGYVSALALRIEIPFVYFLAILPPLALLVRLPISVGGFGVAEVSFVYLAGLLGIPSTQALAVALVPNVVQVLALLPAAFMDPTAFGTSGPASTGMADAAERTEEASPAGDFRGYEARSICRMDGSR